MSAIPPWPVPLTPELAALSARGREEASLAARERQAREGSRLPALQQALAEAVRADLPPDLARHVLIDWLYSHVFHAWTVAWDVRLEIAGHATISAHYVVTSDWSAPPVWARVPHQGKPFDQPDGQALWHVEGAGFFANLGRALAAADEAAPPF